MTTLKTVLATILVPGIACLLVPFFILNRTGERAPTVMRIWQVIAIPMALLGAAMVIWVSFSFVHFGEGTPIPVDPPKHLVANGLYRCTRNPMYAGAILVLLAEGIFFASAWVLVYAIVLWLILHTFVVFIEEPQLKRRFGQPYEVYTGNVPRWLPRRINRQRIPSQG